MKRPDPFDLEAARAVLERTPASLSAMLEGLPETWRHATERQRSWSAHDVIHHLIHCERTA